MASVEEQTLLDALMGWSVPAGKSVELVYSHRGGYTSLKPSSTAGITATGRTVAEEEEDGIYLVPSSSSVRVTQWALWLAPRMAR